jgi:HlyD family secretion protein
MPNKFYVALVACLLVCGCSKKEEAEAEAAPEVPVQVAPVQQASIRRLVEADAVLFPRDQASIVPKISAPVQKFHVSRGDHVKAGELLATLESRDLEAAAGEARSQVAQAEANFLNVSSASTTEETAKAKAEVQAGEQQLEAARKLLESRQGLFQQGALARRQVDEAQVAFAQAQSQLESARAHQRALESVGTGAQIKGAQAQVDAAKAHYQSAEAQLGYAEIRSPISGVVSERPLYAGEMAGAGTPLLTVIDISRIVARANVPQNQAAFLKPGDAATLRAGEAEVAGRVTVVSPATDAATTTVQVWVEAENPGERLKPGANVHVSMVAATIPNALVVPATAILPGEEGGAAVAVVTADSVAHLKNVETGVRDADKVQLLGGVAAGDRVVIVGGVGLEDKAKVRIVQPGQKEEDEKEPKEK